MAEEEEAAAMWLELPYHLVELIMDNLTPEISDYIRCGAVCTSWRTAYIDHPLSCRRLPPFLLVPTPPSSCTKKKNNKKKTIRTKSLSFYNVIGKKVFNQYQVTIPSNRHFRGSSHGWLVSVDQDNDFPVRLLNPFLSGPQSQSANNYNEILLPSLKHLPPDPEHKPDNYTYLLKAVLSADPISNTDDCIVMVIYGVYNKLAFCKPGDKTWTSVEIGKWNGFHDVIYYQGKFYAVHYQGAVVVCDVAKHMAARVLLRPSPKFLPTRVYLVESAGELLQVHRKVGSGAEDKVIQRTAYSTTGFKVFKLLLPRKDAINKHERVVDPTKKHKKDVKVLLSRKDAINKHERVVDPTKKHKKDVEGCPSKWMELKNLCGHTLFLGDNASMSILASDYPGCKPNCIYYTDDYLDLYLYKPWNGPHDIGVFNLEDGTTENHYPTDHNNPIWPIPIWIEPSVHKKEVNR